MYSCKHGGCTPAAPQARSWKLALLKQCRAHVAQSLSTSEAPGARSASTTRLQAGKQAIRVVPWSVCCARIHVGARTVIAASFDLPLQAFHASHFEFASKLKN